MKIAFVHDWLVTYAGAEKVLEQMIACFPEAEIFSVVDFLEDRRFIAGKSAHTTFIQRLPFAKSKYRAYLPLMPIAIEQLDLSGYEIIVSSSHAVAKGVLTGPDQIHISYVHSPIRYAWDLQHQYLRESKLVRGAKALVARTILHYIRMWDLRSANGVDVFLCNSEFIRRRIWKVYRREAQVIYPPVDTEQFVSGTQKSDYFLTASRFVPYKRIDLIVEAFAKMPDLQLKVIGDGPDMAKVRSKASANVEILGYQAFSVLKEHMQRARAFVFAAEEDFGITPVESQACGTPVIAFGKGGALETVAASAGEDLTGIFFYEQTADAIVSAVRQFISREHEFTATACQKNASRFSIALFKQRFTSVVEDAYRQLASATNPVT